MLTVDEVPVPSERDCASDELPTVIAPVPCGDPIVRVPASPVDGLSLVMAKLVPVALVNVRTPRLVMPETFKLVEVALVPNRLVKVRPAEKKFVEVPLEIVVFPRLVTPLTFKFVVVE